MRLSLSAFMIPAAIAICAAPSFAATVLDGAFTQAQAVRGKAAYSAKCAGCHGEDFLTINRGQMIGQKFLDNWREDTIDGFYEFLKANMPRNAAGTVTEKDK